MAATNKTTPFNLSQFVGGDRIKRLDYNADMLNINNALIDALKVATKDNPGQVKIGANINVSADGTISVANTYVLPTATSSVLGGVKIGDNINISNGTISTHGLSNSVALNDPNTGASSAALKITYDKILPAVDVPEDSSTKVLSAKGGKYLDSKIDNLEFSASLTKNGYQKLPSGLIMQWGEFTSLGDATTEITLPISFPNACLQAQATLGEDFNINRDAGVSVQSLTTTSLKFTNGLENSILIRYFAIGY